MDDYITQEIFETMEIKLEKLHSERDQILKISFPLFLEYSLLALQTFRDAPFLPWKDDRVQ